MNYGKKNNFNKYMQSYRNSDKIENRLHQERIDKGLNKLSISQKTQFVMLMRKSLTEKELFRCEDKSFDIHDARFSTSLDYEIGNLPKFRSDTMYNFRFFKDDYEIMMKTPKVMIHTLEYNYESVKGHKLLVTRAYLLAPWQTDFTLPVIYRLDVLFDPNRENFYGIRGSAMVGGFKDGECPFFEMRSGNSIAFTTSGFTARKFDDEDFKPVDIDKQDVNLNSGLEYCFDLFNVKYRQAENLSAYKIFDINNAFRKNKSLYKPIDSKDFINNIKTYVTQGMGRAKQQELPHATNQGVSVTRKQDDTMTRF